MPQKIRMWEVTDQNTLAEIPDSEIKLEQRLEDWLESDISMLDPDLLVIGRQVKTGFGGEIDLLCLDSSGALVVVELKKGKTPPEVSAHTRVGLRIVGKGPAFQSDCGNSREIQEVGRFVRGSI